MFRRNPRALPEVNNPFASRSLQNRLAMSVPRIQREFLLALTAQALDVRLAAGRLSEASMRVLGPGNKFLVTARGCWFGAATERDLLLASMQPNRTLDAGDQPRRIAWHRAVYAATQAKTVLIAQPAALMAYAQRMAGEVMSAQAEGLAHAALPDAFDDAGAITFISAPTDDALGEAAQSCAVIVVQGAGAISYGVEGYEAVARMHSAERWADVALRMG